MGRWPGQALKDARCLSRTLRSSPDRFSPHSQSCAVFSSDTAELEEPKG